MYVVLSDFRRFVHILPHNGYYALAFVLPKMI